MQPRTVSLIITTYNWPQALELVLLSVTTQSQLPTEVIIADDGSTEDTAHLIERMRQTFPVPLIHCWQDDVGFRLAHSRNLAIKQARSDYLIMIDGDMVLHRHFIRDHMNAAAPSRFIQGRRVILSEKITQQHFQSRSVTFPFFSPEINNKINAICCPALSPVMSRLFSKKSYRSVRGCNMAFWRKDVVNVNGFNEAFVGWGREDSEFVVRMLNIGVKRYDLRFGGVAYHLFHVENPRASLAENDKLLDDAINMHSVWCEKGLVSPEAPEK